MKAIQQIKQKVVNKNIEPKDWFRGASGILLIVTVLIVNGFFSFMAFGFDFSTISTGEFWGDYFFRLGSGLGMYAGTYILRKISNLKNKDIINLQTEIKNDRKLIYDYDAVREAEIWLREYYNYNRRLLAYEDRITNAYQKINPIEPYKEEKHYERKLKKYNLQKKKQENLKEKQSFIAKEKKK